MAGQGSDGPLGGRYAALTYRQVDSYSYPVDLRDIGALPHSHV
jgi:hypothetical protein